MAWFFGEKNIEIYDALMVNMSELGLHESERNIPFGRLTP